MRRLRALAISAALVALSLAVVRTQPASPSREAGQEWLSWSPDVRIVFAQAYLSGYLSGKTNACMAAAELFESGPVHDLSESADARCFRRAKSYSKTSDHYARVITDFYQKYSQYRNIPYAYLMLVMTDDRFTTVDEIYQAALAGKIRTRF